MKDFGYDITDYCAVEPMFGTIEDFESMMQRARELGLKVMIDQVFSHTSDQHPSFKESRSSRDNAKADWFVWADSKPDGSPPNNWLSIFGGSAWQWDTRRCQSYMHNFLASQPDLNFHNEEVQAQILDVAKFWMDRGVHGFRLDTANFYFHDKELRENPPWGDRPRTDGTVPLNNPYARQKHLYDKTRPENLVFIKRLRTLLDRYRRRRASAKSPPMIPSGPLPSIRREVTSFTWPISSTCSPPSSAPSTSAPPWKGLKPALVTAGRAGPSATTTSCAC